VTLTAPERRLADRISFDPRDRDFERLRESCAAAGELARSLFARGAIPEIRMRYFDDPLLNPGGRKSRCQVFRDNGRSDEEIVEDGNFLKHLRYMIFGPDLPAAVIDGFRRVLEEDAGSTGMVQDQLRAFVRDQVRTRALERLDAAEAFFMLTLECGESLSLVASVREAAMSVRRK
jgi:hypothetical protein